MVEKTESRYNYVLAFYRREASNKQIDRIKHPSDDAALYKQIPTELIFPSKELYLPKPIKEGGAYIYLDINGVGVWSSKEPSNGVTLFVTIAPIEDRLSYALRGAPYIANTGAESLLIDTPIMIVGNFEEAENGYKLKIEKINLHYKEGYALKKGLELFNEAPIDLQEWGPWLRKLLETCDAEAQKENKLLRTENQY